MARHSAYVSRSKDELSLQSQIISKALLYNMTDHPDIITDNSSNVKQLGNQAKLEPYVAVLAVLVSIPESSVVELLLVGGMVSEPFAEYSVPATLNNSWIVSSNSSRFEFIE